MFGFRLALNIPWDSATVLSPALSFVGDSQAKASRVRSSFLIGIANRRVPRQVSINARSGLTVLAYG